jgi:predicted AlkP superfamily pyrophosphatase or phosphodiesterase
MSKYIKKIIRLGFYLGLFLFFLVSGYAKEQSSSINVILIGWDGAQRNHVKEMLANGKLPNLKQLAKEGTLVNIDITTGATDTKAGWAQILTGYDPEITGVYNNAKYGPIPKGYTVFERLQDYFGRNNITTVAVIGKKQHVDSAGPQHKLITPEMEQRIQDSGRGKKLISHMKVEGDQKYLDIPAEPYYYTSQNIDIFINGLEKNAVVANQAMELLEKYKDKQFFFFIHFAEVDHQGHIFGENSAQYSEALESCDYWTGEVIKKLKALNLYAETFIYVTADHGFNEGGRGWTGHSNAPYVFLATNDSGVVRSGDRKDITPTILKRYGLDLNKIQPKLSGKPLIN